MTYENHRLPQRLPRHSTDLRPIPFSELDSVVTEPTHRSASRVDLFWGQLHADGSNLGWESLTAAERHIAQGDRKETASEKRTSPATLRKRLLASDPEFVDSIASLKMWRCATSEQVSTIAGWVDPDHLSLGTGQRGHARIMRHLWAAGVVDIGRFIVGQSVASTVPYAYRPADDKRARKLLTSIPAETNLRITAGRKWSAGHRHDRHNLLTTELALRVAEHCEVSLVGGEDQATAACLDRTGTAAAGKYRSHAGDAIAIRPDGLRIVFETTSSRRPDLIAAKVHRWSDVLGRLNFDDSAVIVCFVEADNPDRPSRHSVDALAAAIPEALAQRPDAAALRLPERFAFTSWPLWFPASTLVDPSFGTLEVLRPTGPSNSPWEPAHLLDVSDVQLDPTYDHSETFANFAKLGGVPYWLRHLLSQQPLQGG